MDIQPPKFLDSPYFFWDENGWGLRSGAPPDVVAEFNEVMRILHEHEYKPPVWRLIDDD